MSPDVFLSQNQIAYNHQMGENPREMVQNLQTLNDNRDPHLFNKIAKGQNSLGSCARFITSCVTKWNELANSGVEYDQVFATDAHYEDLQELKTGAWWQDGPAEQNLNEYELPA